MNLDHLNDSQKLAVETIEGPCMIIAGAGSGKTSVLTNKIAFLISKGVNPNNIIALTFTNKASKEMQSRVEKILNRDVKSLWIGTFHSLFLKILKIEHEAIGFEKNFSIYDTDESKSLISEIINYLNLDTDVYKPNVVLSRISSAKNRLKTPLDYANDINLINEDSQYKLPMLQEIYKHYFERCRNSFAMDFDDLILNFYILLKNPKILEKYRYLFQYILVDEFQDTNFAQYEIIKILAGEKKNICVVGDDAQSIYAFRGATISNILNFKKNFPEAKLIKLEQNYRSTKSIVGLASSIIKHNKRQIPKSIWTDNDQGEAVQVIRADSDNEEAVLTTRSILDLNVSRGISFSDIVILYRSNFQSRILEQIFTSLNIPYKLIGSISFYQRKEIKDIIAYMKLIVNNHDNESLKRVINTPRRGIGTSTFSKLSNFAAEKNKSIWTIIEEVEDYFSTSLIKKLKSFKDLIIDTKIKIEGKDLYQQLKIVIEASGLMKAFFEDKTSEGKTRHENLQEFLNSAINYSNNKKKENEETNIESFLEDIALINDSINQNKEEKDTVSLMTVHSSKGLEFEYVFLVGMEEDIFPSSLMISNQEDIEEERRLFYVAVTRAKKKLIISYVLSRYRFGKIKNCAASRFLMELDVNFIQQIDKKNFTTKVEKNIISHQHEMNILVNKKKKNSSDLNFCYDVKKLNIGTKVMHPTFSIGFVTKLFPCDIDHKVTISFKQYGEKTFLLKYARLQIIEDILPFS